MTPDTFTAVVWIGFLPTWFARELWVLRRRRHTISQVARAFGWRLTAVVFFYASMPVHWWAPVPWSGSTAGTVAFWLLQAVLLAWNVATWRRTALPLDLWPRWLRWANWPVWYLVGGPLTAALLFPQRQALPWGLP